MNKEKFKIVILTHGGAERIMELLAACENVEIAGIFLETATEPKRDLKQKLERSLRYDGILTTAKKVFKATSNENGKVRAMQDDLSKAAAKLKIPLHKVGNFHDEKTIERLREINADLGILYGTNIVKEKVFAIPRLGSINIHQGLAPFYRGGPPIFWELFNGENEIGITVHFVAAKVDCGDIILQRTFPLRYDFDRYALDYENFSDDFRASLKEPSAQMIVEAISLIAAGKEQRTGQDTSLGKRYRLPIKSEKDALLRLLKERRKVSVSHEESLTQNIL